jgi:hypothetical protein
LLVLDERYEDEWTIQCSIKVCDHTFKGVKTKRLKAMMIKDVCNVIADMRVVRKAK